MVFRPRIVRSLSFLMVAAFAVACTSSHRPASTRSAPPTVAPTSAPTSQDLAGHVRVLGLWSGPEYDNFVTVKSVWEKDTGYTVDWQGTQDLSEALDADEQARTPPDVAILPNLALMQQLAAGLPGPTIANRSNALPTVRTPRCRRFRDRRRQWLRWLLSTRRCRSPSRCRKARGVAFSFFATRSAASASSSRGHLRLPRSQPLRRCTEPRRHTK